MFTANMTCKRLEEDSTPLAHKKKLLIVVPCIVALLITWNYLPYHYSNDRTVDYATRNAASHSRTMCAGYVIRAMWHGGCPMGLVPAYAYNKILPQMGFDEVSISHYTPRRGDISVLPANSNSSFGHIAIYDGKQWISDFKQKSIYPSGAYKEVGTYQIFRISDGWHWKHVWTTPIDWCQWIIALLKGWRKINFG